MSESTKSFNQLGLSEHLLATLSELNFTAPTSVQEQAIPLVLEGKDVLAGAQTGTGKTAAFGLPIIQRLIETKDNVIPNPKLVRALVLVPTRELAQQVFDNVTSYAKGTDIKA
ncbi:DEAD/DEAH box helicase, partial [Vibrio sp. 10N.222.51.A6]